jgi:glycerol-3-phosphate dehydrogenase (NAD(P)+)
MRIGYLGAGTWGFCLASLLAKKGHEVVLWTANADFAKQLNDERVHPKLPRIPISDSVVITNSLPLALENIDLLVESVTSRGIRPMFEQVLSCGEVTCPIVLTSKGIEQNSGLLLPEVVLEVLGKDKRKQIAVLSGPSHAEEVIRELPTAIVCGAYDAEIGNQVISIFMTPFFRIYPNPDVSGVAFGGALKNIIAIACGISDGLGFGDNTKAALMTRGLHEMRNRKL